MTEIKSPAAMTDDCCHAGSDFAQAGIGSADQSPSDRDLDRLAYQLAEFLAGKGKGMKFRFN